MKDYQQIFNERLNERLVPVLFEQLSTQSIQPYLGSALQSVSFFSLSISEKEYNDLIAITTTGATTINMQQAFNALNILKAATPSQLGITLDEYSKLVTATTSALTAWNEVAEPHIQAVRDEVNAEAKEDAQKEQIRNNLKAGGHKGLSKQIALA
jgi:hypothetical protein